LIVDEAGAEPLIEAVRALAGRLVVGPWNGAEEPFMGPLISVRAAEGARARAKALNGRELLATTDAGRGPGWMTPGMVDVTGLETPDAEIFAPVLQVRRAESFDGAVALANDTRFGLAAGLVADDPTLWERFLQRSRAGVVNWNRPTTGAAGDMPFGGLGASGNHRPSAYYAADYCAYPVASFEADGVRSTLSEIKGLRT
ncbi:MAG: aldehyde dehydrogenase family protein, partial [Proteobacteria bacterium]|nr:aldehyde dehydrogenase family protein [Pseudomonadota bacterium]